MPCTSALLAVFGLVMVLVACRTPEEPSLPNSAEQMGSESNPSEGIDAGAATEQAGSEGPFLLGGIQLNEEDHDRWATALLQSGMNAVQVTVYAQQGAWDGPGLTFADDEPAVRAEIRAARRYGLEVVLILRVALGHDHPENRFLWHGMIWPRTGSELAGWFERYSSFVVKWAEIAEAEGVAVLGIGSEMNALAATLPIDELPALTAYHLDEERQRELRGLVARNGHLFGDADLAAVGASDLDSVEEFLIERNQAEQDWARAYTFDGADDPLVPMNARRMELEQHWRAMIAEVRGVFGGRVTFAANFDNYHEVGFWDALDLIGINAYFPLRPTPYSELAEEELVDAWSEVFEEIAAFSSNQGLNLPVVFTELGYTQRDGATAAPWSRTGFVPIWDDSPSILVWSKQRLVPDERASAVRALHAAWKRDGFPLAGILYWKLSSRQELERYEPFMLDIGPGSADPLLPALSAFAGGSAAQPDVQGLPALHEASRRGEFAEVQRLLEFGDVRESRDQWGALALHWACHQSNPEMVSLLLPGAGTSLHDGGAETPITRCARLDNTAVASALIERLQARDELGPDALIEPLARATDQSSVEMVSLLLQAGAAPNRRGSHSSTALHIAARRGDPVILGTLLNAAPGAPAADEFGFAPLDHAAYHGRPETFELLVERALERDPEELGANLLHHAAHGGDVAILARVLALDAGVNRRDENGQTPLHLAVSKEHVAAAELLLASGAELNEPDELGQTPLHLSAAGLNADMLSLLLANEAHVDLRDNAGHTALHYAAGWGRVVNVELLLKAGASADLANQSGETALDLANRGGRRRVAELLGAMDAP